MKKTTNYKVLFLTQGDINQASSRFRVYQYLENIHSKDIDFDYKVMPLPRSGVFRRSIYLLCALLQALKNDVVVIQKLLLPGFLLRLIRLLVPRLVYDWDDALYARPPMLDISEKKQQGRLKKLSGVLRLSDTVICGNQVLADYASKCCGDTRVIPTSVIYHHNIPKKSSADRGTTIGWIGRTENLYYLKQLTAVFNQLHSKYGEHVRLKVVCDTPLSLESPLCVENKLWSLQDEELDILSFDIGIMPLEDTEWARGKCAFKLLQYMALGVPAVGAPVGANTEVICHGENGFVAVDESAWVDCLSQLVENKALRERLASAARSTIENKYSLQANQHAFMNAVIGD